MNIDPIEPLESGATPPNSDVGPSALPSEFESAPGLASPSTPGHEPDLGPMPDYPAFAAVVVTPGYRPPTAADSRRKRNLAINLTLLLGLTLAGFVLTTWILIRMDAPFGIFSTGPREVVRAQLVALDRGEVRGAYDLFSGRYRQQVTFDLWRELILRNWQMFHAEVLRAGSPTQSGAQATIEIHLRGADQKAYRARFKLIRSDGRWWIDDVHWAEESDEHDVSRT